MSREPSTRTGVYYIDAIVAIFMIIVGMLTFVIGVDYLDKVATGGPPIYVTASGWLIIALGLASIIYGIKRMIDDVAKAMAR